MYLDALLLMVCSMLPGTLSLCFSPVLRGPFVGALEYGIHLFGRTILCVVVLLTLVATYAASLFWVYQVGLPLAMGLCIVLSPLSIFLSLRRLRRLERLS